MKHMFTLLLLVLFAGGCVGDDGREIIGSYAPDPDATSSEEARESEEDVVEGTGSEEDAQGATDSDGNLDTSEESL